MKDLQQKNVHRCHRIEDPFTAQMAQVAADLHDSFRGQCLGHIGLELAYDFGDINGHPWPPVRMGC